MKPIFSFLFLNFSFIIFSQIDDLPITESMGQQELYCTKIDQTIKVYYDDSKAIIVFTPLNNAKCACKNESFIVLNSDGKGDYILKNKSGKIQVKLDLIDGIIEKTNISNFFPGECCSIRSGSYLTLYTD
jgi:hypothetical protein